MATVGIVGGLGPESTIDYYRRILAAWEREDPSSAPSIVIDSLDSAARAEARGGGSRGRSPTICSNRCSGWPAPASISRC